MKTRVVVSTNVKAFMASLAPEPRRKLRRGLKELAEGRGDVKQLDGSLAPFWRLRVDNTRIVFDQKNQAGDQHRARLADGRPGRRLFYRFHIPKFSGIVMRLRRLNVATKVRRKYVSATVSYAAAPTAVPKAPLQFKYRWVLPGAMPAVSDLTSRHTRAETTSVQSAGASLYKLADCSV